MTWPLKLKTPTLPANVVQSAVAVSAEALAAADVGPQPLNNTAVIAQLRQQLAAKDEIIAQLKNELRSQPRAVPGCAGCTGLRRTIADLKAEQRDERRTLVRLRLAAPGERERTWTPPPAEVP